MNESTDLSRMQLYAIHYLMDQTDENVGRVTKMVISPVMSGTIRILFHLAGGDSAAFRITRDGVTVKDD